MILKIGKRHTLVVADIAEASRTYGVLRDKSCEGQSTWPEGRILDESNAKVYRVSYNGRVWFRDSLVSEAVR